MRVLVLICALALPAVAGEYAILSSGLRLRIERHECAGDTVRLFTSTGVTELPASLVVSYEAEDYVPPRPAPDPAMPAIAKTAAPSPKQLVDRAAQHNGLPPELVHSVAVVESGYRTDAVSPKGAIGIMQLMPGTAAALSANPRNPAENIEAGTTYLRDLLIKYDGDVVKALAAYNAGPGAVDRYKGLPPYPETQMYVRKVIQEYTKRKPDSRVDQ